MSKRYQNQYIRCVKRKSLHYLLWHLGYYEDILPHCVPPENFIYPVSHAKACDSLPTATWINHCTFIVNIHGITILTDPIWSKRCSPLPMLGPKRQHDLCVELEDLEKVDVVLISHNHYDHLDYRTVKRLHKRFPNIIWVVPKGLKRWFHQAGIKHVKELGWWDKERLDLGNSLPSLTFTSVPAQHNSGRSFFDRDKTLWMGHIVEINPPKEESKTLYFVGDTAYNPYDFKKIGERFPKIDLCLCPIGTYKPERFMRTVHSSPEDAVSIHHDVASKLTLGMHWKTFRLSYEQQNQPPFDLYCEMKKRGLDHKEFIAIEPGVTINW